MQALRSLPQFAGCLGASQHQDGEHRDLGAVQRQSLVEEMAVFRCAAAGAARKACPAAADEARDRVADRVLVVVDDGVAAGRLVAGKPQRVE